MAAMKVPDRQTRSGKRIKRFERIGDEETRRRTNRYWATKVAEIPMLRVRSFVGFVRSL